jgi:apolipoprotein N-acyltransferase
MARSKFVLACTSGILVGLSFPPLPFGLLACVALVPLFQLLERMDSYGETLRYGYLTFLVFNVITLYWVGGFTHGKDLFLMMAGAALLVAHPLFFLVPLIGYAFVKRNFGVGVALLAMPFLWVAFEWLHSLGEIGFPWLTLGNTQSYALERIQFASVTGVYGISFWIVAVNSLAYFLFRKLSLRGWAPSSPNALVTLALLIIITILPGIHGRITLGSIAPVSHERRLRVGIIQPNIDPWQKWQAMPSEQVRAYLEFSQRLRGEKPQLMIWPETAISFRILAGRNAEIFRQLKAGVDSLNVALLTGFADVVYYESGGAPATSKTVEGTNLRYDDFNAMMLLEPGSDRIQKYAKMKLVPFGERVPYADKLSFLANAIKWNVGISGWGIGKDTTVFILSNSESVAKFSGMVCYESIYPELVSSFVRSGAEFLVVITNDSWWGKTSGAYQHERYAVFRAVENRRWIARCANGGISCFIDPYGRVFREQELFTQAAMVDNLELRQDKTFYAAHGDIFSHVCTGVSVVFLSAAFLSKVRKKRA